MSILMIALSLVFVVIMIIVKKKWVIITGWVLVFVVGTILYGIVYSSEIGRMDAGVVMAATISSLRNFLANNDYINYSEKTNSAMFLAMNIINHLAMFMMLLTAVKITIARYSDNFYLFIYGKHRHICVFTDNSSGAVRLADSVRRCIKKSLCVFIGCDRIVESGTKKNVLFLKTPAQLKKYKSEVFICSENAEENTKAFEKLSRQLPNSVFYVFSGDGTYSINKDEFLIRYLFVAENFIPKRFTGNEQAKICIIGDNKLAIELCRELIVQCQSVKGLPQITVIGSDAADNFAFFVKSNPGLGNCAELSFVNEKILSVAGIEALTGNDYDLYFFCDGNEDLTELVPQEKTVKIPEYKAIYDYDIIVNYSLDEKAKELNAEYVRKSLQEKGDAIVDADKEWTALSEFHRKSNRSLALNIPSKKYLRSIGVTMEQLGVEEHLRWNAFHYVNGWLCGSDTDGKKIIEKKLHPCLVPYDELSQNDKDKDLMFIKKIFKDEEV